MKLTPLLHLIILAPRAWSKYDSDEIIDDGHNTDIQQKTKEKKGYQIKHRDAEAATKLNKLEDINENSTESPTMFRE